MRVGSARGSSAAPCRTAPVWRGISGAPKASVRRPIAAPDVACVSSRQASPRLSGVCTAPRGWPMWQELQPGRRTNAGSNSCFSRFATTCGMDGPRGWGGGPEVTRADVLLARIDSPT
jgi:hypothetical protein